MIINQPPKIYPILQKQFSVSWEDGVIITYFPHIYWIGGDALPKEKVAHETTHLRQQEKYGVEKWWQRYLVDKDFRLSQEVEAYRAEIQYLHQAVSNRNKRFKLIRQIALDLSGPMYGGICTYSQAMLLFK